MAALPQIGKDMKQTLEEASQSMAYNKMPDWGGLPAVAKKYFIKGAEWQSNQMAWINVNNKMPEDGIEVDEKTILAHTKDVIVLYKNGCTGKGKRIYIDNKKEWQWSCLKSEDITHWMYYPN